MGQLKYRTFVVILAALLFASTPLFAEVGGQVVAYAAAPLVEDPDSIDDLSRGYRDTDDEDLFGGLEGEIWFDRFGFGLRHAGTFHVLDVDVLDETATQTTSSTREAWWYDGQSDLFAAFHLFGGGSFIDPYLRYGVGFSTRTALNNNFGYDTDRDVWTTAEAPRDEDDDDRESEPSYDRVAGAGMYQYVGAGLQMNLSGLVLGGGVNYNILHQQFGTVDQDWAALPTARFEARIYGGVAF